MKIDIITIFPGMFAAVLNESIIKRAQAKAKVKLSVHNLRDYTRDRHKKVDDRPFGGGSGMVMTAEPIFNAVEHIRSQVASSAKNIGGPANSCGGHKSQVILLSPQGKRLDQKIAKRLARYKHLILICGHYEGIDERVRQYLADQEISIGDYVLTGGELPAMVLVDCLVRLIPGVLGDKNSLAFESFEAGILEYPQYSRPAVFRGRKVPAVLLSGNHKKIEAWRRLYALKATKKKRPDLLQKKGEIQR